MNRSKFIKIAVIVLALGTAGAIVIANTQINRWGQPVGIHPDDAKPYQWLCMNASCGHHFETPLNKLAEVILQESPTDMIFEGRPLRPVWTIACTKCNQPAAVRANNCLEHDFLYPIDEKIRICPRCAADRIR